MSLVAYSQYFGDERLVSRSRHNAVFQARDRVGGQTVAIKKTLPQSNQVSLGIRHEFEFLTRHRHPNIVPAYDFGRDNDGRAFFSMKWIAGYSLANPFAASQKTTYTKVLPEFFRAMQSIHEEGFVHCDLKPSHILVENGKTSAAAKIIDFGMVSRKGIKRPLEMRGTPGYIAPEVLRGDPVNRASDVYSVGVLLKYLTEMKHENDGEADCLPIVESAMNDLIVRCMATNPKARPPDFHFVENVWSRDVLRDTGYDSPDISPVPRGRIIAGRQKSLGELKEACASLREIGGGIVVVEGVEGAGKSFIVEKHRRIAQVRGDATLRLNCGNGPINYAAIREAITMWIDKDSVRRDSRNSLYIYLTLDPHWAVKQSDIHQLTELIDGSGVVCVVQGVEGISGQSNNKQRAVRLGRLGESEFEILCKSLFEKYSNLASLIPFLSLATDRVPGRLYDKWNEYRRFVLHGKNRCEFNWYAAPAKYVQSTMRTISELFRDKGNLLSIISSLGSPFGRSDLLSMSNMAETAIDDALRSLTLNHYLSKTPAGQYEITSPWVDQVLRRLCPSSRESNSVDRIGSSNILKNDLKNAAYATRTSVDLSVYSNLCYLPEAMQAGRAIVRGDEAWSHVGIDIRLIILSKLVSGLSRVARYKAARRWTGRLGEFALARLKTGNALSLPQIESIIKRMTEYGSLAQRTKWMRSVLDSPSAKTGEIKALMLSELGSLDVASNNIESALQKLFEADAIYNSNDCVDVQSARNLGRIGSAYYKSRNLEKALKYYDLGNQLCAECDSPEVSAILKFNIGLVHWEEGRPELALRFFEHAANHAEQLAKPRILASVKRSMALCVADLKPASQALQLAREAYSLTVDAGAHESIVPALSNIGWTAMRSGEMELAEKYISKAHHFAESSDNKYVLWATSLNFARFHRLRGDYRQALDFARTARDISSKFDSSSGFVETLLEIASISLASGELKTAGKMVSQIDQLDTKHRGRRNDFFLDMVRSEIAIKKRKLESAIKILNSWRHHFHDNPLPGWKSHYHRLRAQWLEAVGKRDDSLRCYKRSIRIARESERVDLMIQSYEEILTIVCRHSNPRVALPYLRELSLLWKKVNHMGPSETMQNAIKALSSGPAESHFADLVFNLSDSLRKFSNKVTALDFLLKNAVQFFDADCGALISKHPSSGRLFIEAQLGLDSEGDRDDTLAISKSVIKKVGGNSEPLCIDDALDDPRTKSKKSIIQHNIQSVLCVPVTVGSMTWGVLYLDNRTVPGAFKETDTKILEALANFMAISIDQVDEINRLRLGVGNIPAEGGLPAATIVANSSKMKSILVEVDQLAAHDTKILLLGESGTGKDTIAKYIHLKSPRAEKPFIVMNCAGMVETLAESELFGIEDSVASGVKFREGKFQLAEGGTIFLDEIGDLPLSLQAKLLRTLEENSVERVGGKPMGIDVRFMAATNRDLAQMVDSGEFRLDLFYRLNTNPVTLPPLRDRVEDIPVLVDLFLKYFSRKMGRSVPAMSTKQLDELCEHSWPGNIRELKNVVEHAMIMADKGEITFRLENQVRPSIRKEMKMRRTLADVMESAEREFILDSLEKCGWNKAKTSRWIGLPESSLRTKMKRLSIKKPRKL